MTGRGLWGTAVGVVLAGLVLPPAPGADDPARDAEPTTLVDAAGKEIKLTGVKFTAGTRRLGWLDDPKGLALEVREPHSTTFQKGVVTLVPLASVEAIRYEAAKQQMTVAVKGLPEPVAGTLQFKGINVCALEGSSGGVSGKFSGGVPKDGFKSATFPGAKPLPTRPPGGLAWAVQIEQPKAGHPTVAVRNLKALYTFPGGVELLADALPARKGDPVPLNATLKKLEIVAIDANTQTGVVEAVVGDGPEKLVAFPLTREQAGRTGTLAGLLGEVDAGWKLFPLHTIKVVKPDEKK